ncbi:facilitated trehalose transporter Tret1-2 homolog [Athalia rosae]|uniref:facilitated trehalose transporter Tret1-2 homolog n=1 Tax=Athalia rosae TaxID=37344 RepID=UPI0020336AB3|nr:facilitated trehalose transporter Tret1-2 homolog [Athalia rosae]
MENKSKNGMQILAGLTSTMAMLTCGYHISWASPSLPKLEAADSDLYLTSDQGAWLVSTLTMGCFLGTMLAPPIIDKLGRKMSLLISTVPNIVAGILLAVSTNFWGLIAARFIAGMALGIPLIALPIYAGEIATDEMRGAIGAFTSQLSNVGILLTYSVGPWVNRMGLAGLGIALPVLFFSVFVWMPESPYFLMTKNKRERAIKSLRWLRGIEDVNAEIRKIEESIEFDRRNAGTIKDLVMVPGSRRALLIVVTLMVGQQLSGIGAVLAYSGLIFEVAGTNLDSSVSVIILGFLQALTSVLCIFIVDLMGRKPLLLISAAGSAISLTGVALFFQLEALCMDVSSIFWLPLTGLGGYIVSYMLGLGTLVFVITSEMFAYNVKAVASMVITMGGSFTAMIVTKLYQMVADAWGIHTAFWGFSGITLFTIMFITFFVSETKQRSLQDIQKQYHKSTDSKIALKLSDP